MCHVSCSLDIKLYKLNISVRGHVSMMLICNAMGEARWSHPPYLLCQWFKTSTKYITRVSSWYVVIAKFHVSYMMFLLMFDLNFHPIGSPMCFQKNGSFTQNTFTDVIRHLIDHTPSGKKLLILDGHSSHHTVEALDLYVPSCCVMWCHVPIFCDVMPCTPCP